MRKPLPVKKEYLLIAATLVLGWLCYRLAFKATLDAWQTHRQLRAELDRAADLRYQPGYLKRKNTNLDRVIALYQADTAAFRNNSINLIAEIAGKNKVKLSEVPTQDPFYHADKFIIQKLGFEGDFFSLTKMLQQLQATRGMGIIRSAAYKTVGHKTGTGEDKKLVLEIYLEIVK
jgi:hypothetical protein